MSDRSLPAHGARSTADAPRAYAAIGQERPRRAAAAHAVHGAAGMGGGAGHVEAAQRGAVARELRRRAEDELLVELHRAAAEVAADEARGLGLRGGGAADRAGQDERAEAGCEALQLGLHARSDLVVLEVVVGWHVGV